MKAKIVAAFPGCGKSYACRPENSRFSCYNILLAEIDEDNFEESFLTQLREVIRNFDYIFVPSDMRVLNCLQAEQYHFRLMYPSPWLRAEFILRYWQRGSPEDFQKHMDENFEKLIQECEDFKYVGCHKTIFNSISSYVADNLH